MTASLYSIAKTYLLQSKYKTNNTNNKPKKNNCITNIESCIFIQEEIKVVVVPKITILKFGERAIMGCIYGS